MYKHVTNQSKISISIATRYLQHISREKRDMYGHQYIFRYYPIENSAL